MDDLVWFILRPCQHDNGYIDGRSQVYVHTDERTQVHSAWSSLVITHPSTNRVRRAFINFSGIGNCTNITSKFNHLKLDLSRFVHVVDPKWVEGVKFGGLFQCCWKAHTTLAVYEVMAKRPFLYDAFL